MKFPNFHLPSEDDLEDFLVGYCGERYNQDAIDAAGGSQMYFAYTIQCQDCDNTFAHKSNYRIRIQNTKLQNLPLRYDKRLALTHSLDIFLRQQFVCPQDCSSFHTCSKHLTEGLTCNP